MKDGVKVEEGNQNYLLETYPNGVYAGFWEK
jgi:hypothetical protein